MTSFASQLGLPLAPPPNHTSSVTPSLGKSASSSSMSPSRNPPQAISFASLSLPVSAPPGSAITSTPAIAPIAPIHDTASSLFAPTTANPALLPKEEENTSAQQPGTTYLPTEADMTALLHAAQQHQHISEEPAIIPTENQASHITTTASSSSGASHKPENKWSRNGYGVPINPHVGRFTMSESQIVKRAIESYCAAQNITPGRLCSEADNRSDSLRGAWQDISKELPHRTVQSVYRHGLRLMHPFQRGPWTETETAELQRLVIRYGKKWSAIQAKLNRSADSCRDKYREFSNEFNRGRWKEEETHALMRHIRDYLKVDHEQYASQADMVRLAAWVEKKGMTLPWSVISKRLGNRSRLSCFKRWQKLTGTGPVPGPKSKKRRASPSTTNATPIANSKDGDNGGGAERTQQDKREEAARRAELVVDSLPPHLTTQSNAGGSTSHTTMSTGTPNPIQPSNDQPQQTLTVPDPTGMMNSNHVHSTAVSPHHTHANAITHSKQDTTSNTLSQSDHHLLLTLSASTSYVLTSDVDWGGDTLTRWNALLEQWIIQPLKQNEEAVRQWLDRPVWELAKYFLEQLVEDEQLVQQDGNHGASHLDESNAVEEDQAEIAARTVEAVDLPMVGNL